MAKAKPQQSAAPVANRTATNQARRIKNHAARVASDSCKELKVPHGTARAKRRAAAQASGIAGNSFPEIWAKFRKNEAGQAAS